MPDKPRHRWFRFRLRTLLFAAVPICAGLAWTAHSLEWIRERHDAIFVGWPNTDGFCFTLRNERTKAPGGLWLFGERGIKELWIRDGRIDDAHRLYPEALYHDARGFGGMPMNYDEFKAHLAEIGES